MKVILKNKDIVDLSGASQTEFPKYTSQLINLANQNSGGTRPKVVGQLSSLIQEFTGKTLQEWEVWYLNQHPDAIATATAKIEHMVLNLKQAINQIDKSLIEQWVRDLVIHKTYTGLKFQEAILKKVAALSKQNYRLATEEEEAKGLDGYIGEQPVSIKPASYNSKPALPEHIKMKIIYFEKTKAGIEIEFDPL